MCISKRWSIKKHDLIILFQYSFVMKTWENENNIKTFRNERGSFFCDFGSKPNPPTLQNFIHPSNSIIGNDPLQNDLTEKHIFVHCKQAKTIQGKGEGQTRVPSQSCFGGENNFFYDIAFYNIIYQPQLTIN